MAFIYATAYYNIQILNFGIATLCAWNWHLVNGKDRKAHLLVVISIQNTLRWIFDGFCDWLPLWFQSSMRFQYIFNLCTQRCQQFKWLIWNDWIGNKMKSIHERTGLFEKTVIESYHDVTNNKPIKWYSNNVMPNLKCQKMLVYVVRVLIILAVCLHLNTSRAIVPQFISFTSMINNNQIEIETAQLFVVKQIENVKLLLFFISFTLNLRQMRIFVCKL